MIKLNYITTGDKRYIKNYCKVQMEQEDLIRVKSLACLLEGKYCLHEIIQYIKEVLKIDTKYIWRGNTTDYIFKLPRGHVQLTNDVFYDRCYLHQYVVSKELKIDIEQLGKYIIHHIDMNKGNNDISNLWIFFDTASHVAYHQALKHGDVDIKKFTLEYIESIITDKNDIEVKQYLKILDKLLKVQKRKNAYLLA